MKIEDVNRAPLHRQIADVLREDVLRNYKPDDQLPPENQLAKAFQVSLLTVREALCVLDQEGLVARRRGRGTFVLDPRDRQQVAIVSELNILLPRVSYFYRRLVLQAQKYFDAQDKRTTLYLGSAGLDQTRNGVTCDHLFQDVEENKICGILGVTLPVDRNLLLLCKRKAIPVVSPHPEYGCTVTFEQSSLINKSVAYLVGRGCQKIAFLYHGPQKQMGRIEHSSLVLFRKEMKSHGLPVREEWVGANLPKETPGAGWESFCNIWSASDEKPDGIVVTDDMLFRDAMVAICALGIDVPGELRVCTHANKGGDTLYPFPVARVEVDPDAHAVVMGDMMMKLLRGEVVEPAAVVMDDVLYESEVGLTAQPPLTTA